MVGTTIAILLGATLVALALYFGLRARLQTSVTGVPPEVSAELERLRRKEVEAASLIAAARAQSEGKDQQIRDLHRFLDEATTSLRSQGEKAAGDFQQLAAKLSHTEGDLKATQFTLRDRTEQLAQADEKIADLEKVIEGLQQQIASFRESLGASKQQLNAAQERLAGQEKWITEQSRQLETTFSQLASKIVDDRTTRFKSDSKDAIDTLIAPLKVQIEGFRSRIDEVHTKDSESRAILSSLVERLGRTHQELSERAESLTEALTTKSHAQGGFGQHKLEVQLEDAGFQEGKHYLRQPSFKNELDEERRPDAVILMPRRTGYLAVDAKLTLTAWVRVIAAKSAEERAAAVDEVVASLRAHIDGLAVRDYPDLMDGDHPVPYTVMYIPIEGAYLAAVDKDPGLLSYAQKKRILLATPTYFFQVVTLIGDLWRVADQQSKWQEIAAEGEKLFKKLNGFLESFAEIEQRLDQARDAFKKADGQLHSGRGNAIGIVRRMSDLGISTDPHENLQRAIARTETEDSVVIPLPTSQSK
jgi:DNA recombination protein RmuC